MNPLNYTEVQISAQSCRSARHITDLFLSIKNSKSTICLRWYSDIPLVGYLVSYLRFLFVDSADIRSQIKDYNRTMKREAEEYVRSSLKPDIFNKSADDFLSFSEKLINCVNIFQDCICKINPNSKFTLKSLIQRQFQAFDLNSHTNVDRIEQACHLLDKLDHRYQGAHHSEQNAQDLVSLQAQALLMELKDLESEIPAAKEKSKYELKYREIRASSVLSYFPELQRRYLIAYYTWKCLYDPPACKESFSKLQDLNYESSLEVGFLIIKKIKKGFASRYRSPYEFSDEIKLLEGLFLLTIDNASENDKTSIYYQKLLDELLKSSLNSKFVLREFLLCLQASDELRIEKTKSILSNLFITYTPEYVTFLEKHVNLLLTQQNLEIKLMVIDFLIVYCLSKHCSNKEFETVLMLLQKLNVLKLCIGNHNADSKRVDKLCKNLLDLTHLDLSNYFSSNTLLKELTRRKLIYLKLGSINNYHSCISFFKKYLLQMKTLKTLDLTSTYYEAEWIKNCPIENVILPDKKK